MRHHVVFAVAAFLALGAAQLVTAQTVDEILSKLDANMSYGSIRYTGRLEISVGAETRYKTMDIVGQGSTRGFAEFTNPEDKGTRYLKLDKNLWIYFPKEQDTVKISGHLLKEGMMGSDISYEDALESSDFRATYEAAVKGEDSLDGRRSFVVELNARVPTAAYERRTLWIDAERFVTLKQEMYAKSGRLLKVSRSSEVVRVGERWFPSRTEYESRLRNNTRTVFLMSNMQFDTKLDGKQFSLSALTK
jgi:outer membrane lipoprotein-sorting protein